jgi:hypothetical protein
MGSDTGVHDVRPIRGREDGSGQWHDLFFGHFAWLVGKVGKGDMDMFRQDRQGFKSHLSIGFDPSGQSTLADVPTNASGGSVTTVELVTVRS